ncbi:MAG: aldo/keto reductase [Gemmatimonadaceae bacterium]
MKIDRRNFLVASSAALALGKTTLSPAVFEASSETPEPPEVDRKLQGRQIAVYTTADKSDYRLSRTDTLTFKPMGQPQETQVCVFVDPSKRSQTHVGIGGALTDASAETYAKLPAAKQREIMDAYFDPNKGIGYTIGRTTIHSCDFSSGSYTYVSEGDKELKSFNVAHDRQFRIPFTKKAIATAGGKLTIFASPWSPPPFMKTNNDMLHGGKLRSDGTEEGSVAEQLTVLADLQREGLIRHIGLSNATAVQVAEARTISDIVCVQNNYNLAHRHDDGLIDDMARQGIAYVPFFPLGGFTPLQSSTLSDVAGQVGSTPMQVALAWLLHRSPNILLIPGTSSVTHLRENLAAGQLELSPRVLAELGGVAAAAR